MAFTNTFDTATPVGTDAPSILDDRDRETKAAIQERLNVDHFFELTGTEVSDAATGQHRQIEFYGPITKPTSATNKLFLYGKDVDGVIELHVLDESGNEVQLTSGGAFNVGLLTSKTITTPTLTSPTLTSPVINTGVSGTAILDEDDMASDSATQLATQQSIAAYISSKTALSAYSAYDSDNNALLKSHSYLAQTDGFVLVHVHLGSGRDLKGYVGLTSNPVGAGTLVQSVTTREDNNVASISFPVASGEYFEIVSDGTPSIYWKSIGTLTKPVDQD